MPQVTSESGTSFQFYVSLTCIYRSTQFRIWISLSRLGSLGGYGAGVPPSFPISASKWKNEWLFTAAPSGMPVSHHPQYWAECCVNLGHFLALGILYLNIGWSHKWKWVELMFAFVHKKRESTCSWNKQMWKHFSLIKMFTTSSKRLTVEPVMDPSAVNPSWGEYV